MDVREFIAKNVERHRKAAVTKDGAPMTQIALADALDVDRAYVSALERGLRNPTVVTLYRIAKALGVPFSALFEVPEGSDGPTEAPKDREFKKNKSK
jgi:transcriptional regulator with XRE-family HTH domain